jgi:hypothetical protein
MGRFLAAALARAFVAGILAFSGQRLPAGKRRAYKAHSITPSRVRAADLHCIARARGIAYNVDGRSS